MLLTGYPSRSNLQPESDPQLRNELFAYAYRCEDTDEGARRDRVGPSSRRL